MSLKRVSLVKSLDTKAKSDRTSTTGGLAPNEAKGFIGKPTKPLYRILAWKAIQQQ